MPGLLPLYHSAVQAFEPLLNLLLKIRVRHGKEDLARLPERKGIASRPCPQGRLIWIHAASVGEAQSALILIDALGQKTPGINILVTTGTVTSASLMERRLPSFAFHQYVPLDHPAWVRKFLDHWKPELALWMESELWPNTLLALKKRNVPAILVNARLSEKSFRNWKLIRREARKIVRCFTMILAQTDKDALHYRELGGENVAVTDNLKYSAAKLPCDDLSLSALRLATDNRPLWVYASTHAGEESLACRIHKNLKEEFPGLLTILVPRHPNRRDEIAGVCFENGAKFTLRSNNVALPSPDDDIYIADTLGELGLFYTLSDIAVIGRSFSDDGGGGHNPVEAAQLGCAVLTGPNNQYQRQLYDDMQAGKVVIETKDEEELCAQMAQLFRDKNVLTDIQAKTSNFVQEKSGVINNVLAILSPYIAMPENRNAA